MTPIEFLCFLLLLKFRLFDGEAINKYRIVQTQYFKHSNDSAYELKIPFILYVNLITIAES